MRAFLGAALRIAAAAFAKVAGLTRASRWSAQVAQNISLSTRSVDHGKEYVFAASNPLLLWRARTAFTKEPETIAWLRSFDTEDVFFDVGANVGTFSIVAARHCRQVYAFEPEAANFAILNENISLNGMDASVTAFAVALSDEHKLETLRLSRREAGAALHAFGSEVDFKGEAFVPQFHQGSVSFTLDELVFSLGLPCPSYIKIDVDGLEARIVRGGLRVMGDPRLKGLLIEMNEQSPEDMALIEALGSCGLQTAARGDAISDAGGKWTMRNYIFRRA